MIHETQSPTRLRRVGSHLRRHVVGYIALFIAVSMTPLPSYAAGALVGTNDLKDKSVTTAKLRGNAVTGPKIANGTIRKADIAAGTRGYTTVRTKRFIETGVAQNFSSTNVVFCPAGQFAVGGGAYFVPGGVFNATAGDLQVSVPFSPGPLGPFPSLDSVAPTGWRTEILNDLGDGAKNAVHYAICVAK